VIRVAAVADIHMDEATRGRFRSHLEHLPDRADVLLLGGDLTKHGTLEEAQVVRDEYRDLGLPVIAVLGNHDYHSDEEQEITALLQHGGITVLEGDGVCVDLRGRRLGVAGVKGFGGGFLGRCGSDFGEPEMKAFIRHAKERAGRLRQALEELDCDVRVALTHYSPVADTLAGEPLEIFPFLGSYLLAEAIDDAGAGLAVHGHAHMGSEKGITAGGVRVRNVAQPVIRHAYTVYCLDSAGELQHSA
jgi:Icc-related predicted phosphoesterase